MLSSNIFSHQGDTSADLGATQTSCAPGRSYPSIRILDGTAYPYLSPTLRHKKRKIQSPYIFFFLINGHVLSYSERHASLIHEFLRFTTKGIDGISKVWLQSPTKALTWIQRQVLIVASITSPTHMLPLLAIAEALWLRFGVSPSPLHRSPFVIQSLSTSILVSFGLTYSSHLSSLV